MRSFRHWTKFLIISKWRGEKVNYSEFKEILNKFSKKEISDFLGDKIYDAIIEWSDSEDAYTKSSLIDLLVSINGYGLFRDKSFRMRFFKSVPIDVLKKALSSKLDDHEKLASKAAKINFEDNEFYRVMFYEFLKCPEYTFADYIQENMLEEITHSSTKFYELLDYQYLIKQQAIYELTKETPLGRKILIHMPTGTGKTKTAMHILTHYFNFVDEKALVIWVAHTKELLGQAFETFSSVWSHLGLRNISVEKSWGLGEHSINSGMIFTTIQSLQTMRKNNPELYNTISQKITLMVYDECHKIGAKETNKIVADFSKTTTDSKKHFIGLTATPGRTTVASLENRIFNEFFDRKIEIDTHLVDRISMGKNQAINNKQHLDIIPYFQSRKILSKLIKEELKYDVPEDLIDEIRKEAHNKNEKFSDELIEKIAKNKARNSVILEKLKQLNSENQPTIVFACSVDHAKMLSAFLNIENIPNSLVYGDMLPSIREKAISDFKDKDNNVNIIINYDILTTGFDSTNIECVFITRPTKSVILYSQMIGRGLRGPQMGGGETCLLVDVIDNLTAFDENEAFSHFDSYWR